MTMIRLKGWGEMKGKLVKSGEKSEGGESRFFHHINPRYNVIFIRCYIENNDQHVCLVRLMECLGRTSHIV